MKAFEQLTKDKIDEATIHIQRGLELLAREIDPEVCAKVDRYMAMPYTISVKQEGNLFVGRVKELKAIEEYGKTYDKAYANTLRTMIYYFKSAIEQGKDIPLP